MLIRGITSHATMSLKGYDLFTESIRRLSENTHLPFDRLMALSIPEGLHYTHSPFVVAAYL